MICEATLSFCVGLYGGLGVQEGYGINEDNYFFIRDDHTQVNDYGLVTGEIGFRVSYGRVFAEMFHGSGINTEELDFGLNALLFGYETTWNNFYVNTAFGFQTVFENPTNDYGNFLTRGQLGYRWNNGLFAQFSNFDYKQNQYSAGFWVSF